MPRIGYRAKRKNRKFNRGDAIRKHMADWLFNDAAPEFEDEFNEVVEDWTSAVGFDTKERETSNRISAWIYPDGSDWKIYSYVTLGTEGPYLIPKSGPGYLAFQLGYRPKTKPVGRHGGPGIATGPWIRGIMQVEHPGIDPREFELKIKQDNERWFYRDGWNEWRKAVALNW